MFATFSTTALRTNLLKLTPRRAAERVIMNKFIKYPQMAQDLPKYTVRENQTLFSIRPSFFLITEIQRARATLTK